MTSDILYLVSYTVYSLNEPGRHKLKIFRQREGDFGCGNVAMHQVAVLVGFRSTFTAGKKPYFPPK